MSKSGEATVSIRTRKRGCANLLLKLVVYDKTQKNLKRVK